MRQGLGLGLGSNNVGHGGGAFMPVRRGLLTLESYPLYDRGIQLTEGGPIIVSAGAPTTNGSQYDMNSAVAPDGDEFTFPRASTLLNLDPAGWTLLVSGAIRASNDYGYIFSVAEGQGNPPEISALSIALSGGALDMFVVYPGLVFTNIEGFGVSNGSPPGPAVPDGTACVVVLRFVRANAFGSRLQCFLNGVSNSTGAVTAGVDVLANGVLADTSGCKPVIGRLNYRAADFIGMSAFWQGLLTDQEIADASAFAALAHTVVPHA